MRSTPAPAYDPPPNSCTSCESRAAACLADGLDAEARCAFDALTCERRKLATGAALYARGEPFHALYAVRSGALKTVTVSAGAFEKVVGLRLPGEIAGAEAIDARRHPYGAIALQDTEVCVFPYRELTAIALRTPQLSRRLARLAYTDRGLLLLLPNLAPEQRVALFVLSLAARYRSAGLPHACFSLRMSDAEIGSYLALPVSTVAAVFAGMQTDGVLCKRGRAIELFDRSMLEQRLRLW
jgi:CRP/FNR family transcriptional regulator